MSTQVPLLPLKRRRIKGKLVQCSGHYYQPLGGSSPGPCSASVSLAQPCLSPCELMYAAVPRCDCSLCRFMQGSCKGTHLGTDSGRAAVAGASANASSPRVSGGPALPWRSRSWYPCELLRSDAALLSAAQIQLMRYNHTETP